MNQLEFTLATIAQELRVLATTRHASRETWLHVAMPSVVRVATLCNLLADERNGEQEAALRALSGAASLLVPPTEGSGAARDAGAAEEAWRTVAAAALEVRRVFAGTIEAWVLPR